MFAMLAAFGAEVATRQPIFVQIQKAPLAIAATFVVIIAASVQFCILIDINNLEQQLPCIRSYTGLFICQYLCLVHSQQPEDA